MRADAIQPGDVIHTAVGPTLVLAVKATHGGVECRVRRSGDSPFLWFWPHQHMTVLRRDPEAVERWREQRDAGVARLKKASGGMCVEG